MVDGRCIDAGGDEDERVVRGELGDPAQEDRRLLDVLAQDLCALLVDRGKKPECEGS